MIVSWCNVYDAVLITPLFVAIKPYMFIRVLFWASSKPDLIYSILLLSIHFLKWLPERKKEACQKNDIIHMYKNYIDLARTKSKASVYLLLV